MEVRGKKIPSILQQKRGPENYLSCSFFPLLFTACSSTQQDPHKST